jgi:hypothetical protein
MFCVYNIFQFYTYVGLHNFIMDQKWPWMVIHLHGHGWSVHENDDLTPIHENQFTWILYNYTEFKQVLILCYMTKLVYHNKLNAFNTHPTFLHGMPYPFKVYMHQLAL